MSSRGKDTEYMISNTDKIPCLTMRDRILLCLYDRDKRMGRDGRTDTDYMEKREALFMFCTTLMHSREMTLFSILEWDELDDLNGPDTPEGLSPRLPLGCLAFAHVKIGSKRKFRNAIESISRDGLMHGFVCMVRALEGGFGGRETPHLDLWRKSGKVSEIIAISLTTKGFQIAESLSNDIDVILPWQIHPRIAEDEKFADIILGKKSDIHQRKG